MSDDLEKLLQEQLDMPDHSNRQVGALWNQLRQMKIEALEDAICRQRGFPTVPGRGSRKSSLSG